MPATGEAPWIKLYSLRCEWSASLLIFCRSLTSSSVDVAKPALKSGFCRYTYRPRTHRLVEEVKAHITMRFFMSENSVRSVHLYEKDLQCRWKVVDKACYHKRAFFVPEKGDSYYEYLESLSCKSHWIQDRTVPRHCSSAQNPPQQADFLWKQFHLFLGA